MPSVQLGSRDASRFEIVGAHGPIALTVVHVALLAQASQLQIGTSVDVFDMGPPLNLSPPSPMIPDVVGWLPLSPSEEEGLDAWRADMLTFASECSYIGHPAKEARTDLVTGRVTAFRFSCAGFVQSAYSEGARVPLVVREADLPLLDFGTIRTIWQHILPLRVSHLPDEALQRLLTCRDTLRGPGPWPVLAPGYLLHALAQPRAALPYTPSAADLCFPRPAPVA